MDDNRDLADNVAEMVLQLGCEVRAVYSVEGALAALSERSYKLAIVDLRMPGGGGLAVLSAVKSRNADAEVVLMTANASVDSAIQAVAEGAFAYLEKPFEPQQLLMLCERALSQVRLKAERLELQRDLERSEALYREVVDTVSALIFGIDHQGVIRMCNAAAAETLGVPRQKLCGRACGEFMVSDGAREVLREALRQVRAGMRMADLELPLLTHEGTERLVRFSLSQMDLGRSYDVMVLAVGVDMTDRLELERRAAEAQAMASMATLTAGLAHEVRNPLNAATLQLQLLARQVGKLPDALRDRFSQRVGIVELELSRLTKLLDDFLKLARPQRLEMQPVDLAQLMRDLQRVHGVAARDRGVALHLDLAEEAVLAEGDAGMLRQVLVNLLNNSLEAVGSGGRITLRCMVQGRGRVAFELQDDGAGIPDEVRSRLFTPFVTTKAAGTGLGLTIVKRIVDRHGGTISVHSHQGRGTSIRVVLPRSLRPSQPPPSVF